MSEKRRSSIVCGLPIFILSMNAEEAILDSLSKNLTRRDRSYLPSVATE